MINIILSNRIKIKPLVRKVGVFYAASRSRLKHDTNPGAMKKGAFLFVVLLTASLGPATAQQFQIPISVSDGPNAVDLTLGVDANGTNGFDSGLDLLAPPPPFPGAFDARYRIGPEDFLTDIRFNDLTQKTFTMLYQEASGQGPIVLTWDSTGLAALGTFEIVDDLTGALFGPLDMTTTNTLDVSTAPGILDAGLRVLVTPNPAVTLYVAPPPAGSDADNNDCTNPLSPCATIAHAVSQAVNGDTLDLAAGTYNEPGLVIDKFLHILGQGVLVQ